MVNTLSKNKQKKKQKNTYVVAIFHVRKGKITYNAYSDLKKIRKNLY